MDSNLLASLANAVSGVQSLTGETVVIATVIYPCTAAMTLSSGLAFEFGGATSETKCSVCVLKSDLATSPAIDAYATFRSKSMRVHLVEDLVVQWHIHLIQQLS